VADRVDVGCLERLCELAAANEAWLAERVIARAAEAGFGDETPRSRETWREAIRGLTDALFQAVYAISEGYAEGRARHDPVVAYGVVRARTHSPRAVTPEKWAGMLTCYRGAYLDLLDSAEFNDASRAVCARFIDRVFERFESGFHAEWEAASAGGEAGEA
jgi:hypothetical protein